MKLEYIYNLIKSEKAFIGVIYFYALVFGLTPFLSSVAMTLFCVLSLFHFKKRQFYFSEIKEIMLLAAIFLIYFVGCWFTNYTGRAIQLTIRLSPIFFIPVIIYFTKAYLKINYQTLKKCFVIGVIVSSLISLLAAAINFAITNDVSDLFYYKLGGFLHMHPTYYALFVLTALHFVLESQDNVFIKHRLWISPLFLVFIYLLQSKIAIIGVFLLATFFFFKNFKRKGVFIEFLIPLVLLMAFVWLGHYNENNRFSEFFAKREKIEMGNFKEDGVSQRAWLWSQAYEQIKSKPLFGYGLGAQNKYFHLSIEKKMLEGGASPNYSKAVKKIARTNLHNQFIQTCYEFGYIGLSIFLLSIALIYRLSFKSSNSTHIIIFSLFLAFMLTENLLERQMGVYFYSFIISFLFYEKENRVFCNK